MIYITSAAFTVIKLVNYFSQTYSDQGRIQKIQKEGAEEPGGVNTS